jgi:hypothetical protein
MKKYFLLISILTFVACEKDKGSIDVSIISNFIIMDPHERSADGNDVVQDTVYYYFKENNEMTKIRFNYSLINDKVSLESKDTVECVYYAESNHLYMTTDWEKENDYLVPSFGRNENEWVVLKLDSDTLIVDRYLNGTERSKVGRIGFCVLKKE